MARVKLFFLVLLSLACWGQVHADQAFWVVREEPLKDAKWLALVPKEEKLAKQAVLLYAKLPGDPEPLSIRQVLGDMYRQIDELKVLGRKSIPWKQSDGTLVSFSGLSGKNKVVGRAVIAASDESVEVLMLVRHPRSDARILESYEKVRGDIEGFLSEFGQ